MSPALKGLQGRLLFGTTNPSFSFTRLILVTVVILNCAVQPGHAAGTGGAGGDNGAGHSSVQPGLTNITAVAAGSSHRQAVGEW